MAKTKHGKRDPLPLGDLPMGELVKKEHRGKGLNLGEIVTDKDRKEGLGKMGSLFTEKDKKGLI
jgi:hypothetical protein